MLFCAILRYREELQQWFELSLSTVQGFSHVIGSAYSNLLLGTSSHNSLSGWDGDDLLVGGSGNDTLDGGSGYNAYQFEDDFGIDTLVDSGEGAYFDFSALTDDLTFDDVTSATATANGSSVFWSLGNVLTALVIGGSGNDLLLASDEDNMLSGNEGEDTIQAGGGNDLLSGGAGNDLLNGAAGNDTYLFNDAWGVDSIADASGSDTVDLSAVTANLTISLTSSGSDEVTDGTNTINWSSGVVETVITGSGEDSISGSSNADSMSGGAGNDSVNGGGGNDTLDGGVGADVYFVYTDNWGHDVIVDGAENNVLNMSNGASVSANLAVDFDAGTLTDGTNTITWSTGSINQFYGGTGNDTIPGSSSGEVIHGWGGDDSISAGDGNDRVLGGSGTDTIDGGLGSDTYQLGGPGLYWGQDSIVDAGGRDYLELLGSTQTFVVNLTAGAGDEVIDSLGNTINWTGDIIEDVALADGNDTVYGSAGNNTINLGGGNDVVYAGDGNDVLALYGSMDSDSADGGAGNDSYILTGIWGTDTITGDASGIDLINLQFASGNYTVNLGTSGIKVTDGISTLDWDETTITIENVNGGSGNDLLIGNSSNNILQSLGGNDTLNGGGGNDNLVGLTGNDVYVFDDNWGVDTITSESSGTDTLDMSSISSGTNLTINLTASGGNEVAAGSNTINWAGDVIENAYGGAGNDGITGSSGNNTLIGNDGADTLAGQGGHDSLSAGAGNDILGGGAGNDTLDGGAGDDSYTFGNGWGSDTISDDSSGNYDGLQFTGVTAALTINLTTGTGVEVTDGTNTVEIAGDFIERAKGGSANDTIVGNTLHNTLWGDSGNDSISGEAGHDTIIAGDGNDSLDGGAGNDEYHFGLGALGTANWGQDIITADSSGTDLVEVSTTANVTINLTAGAGDEITDGTNTVNWSGNIIENATGGSGNDSITGHSGANSLTGGAGNDSLTGGTGNDTLSGGAGNDTYYFSEGDGADTINEAGDTGTNTDKLLFDSSVAQAEVAVFMNGSNLEVGNTSAGGDKITIQNQNTSGSTIERFELSTGLYMTAAEINQVISDMTTYATNNSISLTSLDDVKNDSNLMAIVNGGWHS